MAKRGRPIIRWNRYRYDESLCKRVRKKRYKHPVITVVKLDPDQVVLSTCLVGGIYLDNRVSPPYRYVCWSRIGGVHMGCSRNNRKEAASLTFVQGSNFADIAS